MRLKRFGVSAACLTACFLSGAVVFLGYQSRAAAEKAFGNMAYLTTYPDWRRTVTLVDGQYSWSERSRDGAFWSYGLYYEGHSVYGDFNRDGLKDAAVILSEGEGGSGDFRALAFLIHDGRQLVHRMSYGLGDRARINSLTVRDHRVIVDAYVHGPHDCMAWPTKRIRNAYDYLQPDQDPLSCTVLSPGRDRAP